MTTRRVVWRSLKLVLVGGIASGAAILVWPELAPAVVRIADGLFWSVAFVLATSLATFNNALRIFDRIEEMVKGHFDHLPQNEQNCLMETIESTERMIANLMWNSLIVILAGIAYFVVGAFLSVPSPRWLPSWIEASRLDVMGVATRFGLGLLATKILVIQFQAIPPMVAFYKFFAVDRHLPRKSPRNRAIDESGEAEKPFSSS